MGFWKNVLIDSNETRYGKYCLVTGHQRHFCRSCCTLSQMYKNFGILETRSTYLNPAQQMDVPFGAIAPRVISWKGTG